ncbi:MAG: hypothetical protein QXP66_00965 [Candidatus Aenigmatarchaeota archaeon]
MNRDKLKKLAKIAQELRQRYPDLIATNDAEMVEKLAEIALRKFAATPGGLSSVLGRIRSKAPAFGFGALLGGGAGALGTYLALKKRLAQTPTAEEVAYYLWPYLMT